MDEYRALVRVGEEWVPIKSVMIKSEGEWVPCDVGRAVEEYSLFFHYIEEGIGRLERELEGLYARVELLDSFLEESR
jgi:hypothetical protein